ncbi:hypothetical protein [Lentzea sp. NPDC055074]
MITSSAQRIHAFVRYQRCGEHSVRLVEVSLSASEASVRSAVVVSWLSARGVVVRTPSRDPLIAPSEFVAGPRHSAVVEGSVSGANTSVDVVVSRLVHHASGNYEPPACPGCGAAVDDHESLLEPWLHSGVEPLSHCACGLSVPAGDLAGRFSFQVGELAVVFHNWPPLLPSFVDELGAVMGPRTRVVVDRT